MRLTYANVACAALLLVSVISYHPSRHHQSKASLSSCLIRKAVSDIDSQTGADVGDARKGGAGVFDENTFAQFNLPSWLVERCNELGYSHPTSVQKESLPSIMEGNDVVVQSQTGSGKTLVYSLPVLAGVNPSRAAIQAVIIVPTRELGLQVAATMKSLAAGSRDKILVMSVFEGSKNRRQQLWATAEPPHVIVGNPKALQRLVDMGRVRLNSIDKIVIDEVDICLDYDETRKELHNLLSRRLSKTYMTADIEDAEGDDFTVDSTYRDLASKHRDLVTTQSDYRLDRQTIMCSATIPQRQHFLTSCQSNGWTQTIPQLVHTDPDFLVPAQVLHSAVECESLDQRIACLKYLITKELKSWGGSSVSANAPSDADSAGNVCDRKETNSDAVGRFQAMVFVDDIEDAEEVVEKLNSKAIKDTVKQVAAINTEHITPIEVGNPKGSKKNKYSKKLRNKSADTASDDDVIDNDSDDVAVLIDDSLSLDGRSKAMKAFREGRCRILVTTDVCGRGIDVPETSHVFQYSLPDDVETYLHRSGRTGRLGRHGKVVTFVRKEEDFVVRRYSNELGVEIKKTRIQMKKKPGKNADLNSDGEEAVDAGSQ